MLWDRYALPCLKSAGAVDADTHVQASPCALAVPCSALTGFAWCRHQHAQSFYAEFKSSKLLQPAQEEPLSEAMPHSAPLAMASFDIAQRVVAAVRTVLGTDVGPEQPLVAAGLDSLGVLTNSTIEASCLHTAGVLPACSLPRGVLVPGTVELRNELSRIFTIDLPGTLVYDHPTSSAIAALLSAHLSSAPEQPASGVAR